MSENNRLVKISENDFILKVASIESKEEVIEENGLKLTVRYGEFAPFLKLANQYLAELWDVYIYTFYNEFLHFALDTLRQTGAPPRRRKPLIS